MNRPLKVLLKGPFSIYSGYGGDGFSLLRELDRWGLDVYPQPTWLDVPIPPDLLHLFGRELVAPFDLTINHWDPAHLGITQAARKATRCAVAWCVDEETEILTRRGWLRWDEVCEGDYTLGIDPQSGLAGWQEVRAIYRSGRASHEMVRLTSPGHESLTNPGHRWLIRDSSGALVWRTSDSLLAGDRIIRSAPCSQLPPEAKYSDAFVELVAWTYTEGWLERGKSIRIGQNERVNQSKTARIRAALQALCGPAQPSGKPASCRQCGSDRADSRGRITRARGLCHTCYMREWDRGTLDSWTRYETWTESPRKPDGMVIFNISRPVSREIMEACPGKVPSMEFLLALTSAQLELFISVSLLADGHGSTFSQTRGPRLDAFVMACVLAGRPVSRPHRTNWEHLATVSVAKRETAVLRKESMSRERYEGVIWCPSVEHGNWLARRAGHIFYTGNTMWEFANNPSTGKGALSHCEGRSRIRRNLRWFDVLLAYDDVSMAALEPYIPARVARGVLQGGYPAAEWPAVERDWNGEKFGFFMHGQLGARKAPMVAIQAFNELKHERPEFAGAYFNLHTNTPGMLFPEMNDIFADVKIRVHIEAWDKPTLVQFYAQHHVGLFPSRGEGKNLPALEFLSTGGTVLATDFGGHRGWLREDIGYPLPYELTPTFQRKPEGAHDAKVSVATLKDAMWHVYTHRAEARRKGQLGSQLIPQMCDWGVVVESLFRRIRDLEPHNGTPIYDHAMRSREAARERAGEGQLWP